MSRERWQMDEYCLQNANEADVYRTATRLALPMVGPGNVGSP